MQRIRFTRKELELILEMTGISEAAGLPEGDYQDWDTDGKYKTMATFIDKATEMLHRRQSK